MKRGFKKIVFLTLLSVLTTSCGKVKNEETYIYPKYEEESSESHKIELTDWEIEELRLDKLTEEYSKYFSGYSVEYNYIDSYITNEQIDQIIEYSNIETHCEQGAELDTELFFDLLRENSKNYVKDHPQYQIPFLEEDFLEEDFLEEDFLEEDFLEEDFFIDEYALCFENNLRYTIDTIINGKNDIYEDLHQVANLTIVFGNASDFYNSNEHGERCYLVYASEDNNYAILGVYDSYQNIIVIDEMVIYLMANKYNEENLLDKYSDILLETLLHEFNHVRQKACDCRVEQGLVLADMFVYDNNYVSTISESSAESELYIMSKYPQDYSFQFDDYAYEKERADELLLLTLALCNENANIEDYYNAIADTNYVALYNFYDLQSREDIHDFYRIVYAIDSKNLRSNLWESIYTEEELAEKTVFEYTVDIGYAYRVDIFRMTLEKLTKYTNNKGSKLFTLKQNLAIFNILKNIIVKDSYMYYEDNLDDETIIYRKYYEEYMVKNIAVLEYEYIKFLSEYYGASISEIRCMEDNEIQEFVQNVINVVNYQYTSNRKDKEAFNLIYKFPILSTLLRKRYISPYDYTNFVEANQKILGR